MAVHLTGSTSDRVPSPVVRLIESAVTAMAHLLPISANRLYCFLCATVAMRIHPAISELVPTLLDGLVRVK
jgi:hypothetical protein